MLDPLPRRALAVFAHPDDESWAAGGLLARLANAGADVHLVTLTRGERGVDLLHRRRGPVLAAAREQELIGACERLGPIAHTILGLPDLGVSAHATAEGLAPILDRLAPDLIVGFAHDGGYGHIDHVHGVAGTLSAARACAHRLTVLGAVFPRGLLEPLRARLAARAPALLHPDYRARPLDGHARDDEQASLLTLHLAPREADAKRQALMAHGSQLGRAGPDGFLGPGIFSAVASVERYRVLLAHYPARC